MPASWLVVFAITLVLLGAGVLAMAIGVIFRRPCLRGSCGGPEVKTASGESLSCATCPNKHKHKHKHNHEHEHTITRA